MVLPIGTAEPVSASACFGTDMRRWSEPWLFADPPFKAWPYDYELNRLVAPRMTTLIVVARDLPRRLRLALSALRGEEFYD